MVMLVVLSLSAVTLSAGNCGNYGIYDSDSNDSTCTTYAAGVICATETLAFVSFKDGFASHDSLIGVHSDYGTSELICPTVDHSSKFETCAANVSLSSETTVRAGRTFAAQTPHTSLPGVLSTLLLPIIKAITPLKRIASYVSQAGLISVSMLGTDGVDCSTSAHGLNVSSFNPAERMSHYGDGMIAWLLARAQLSPITAASDVLSTNALHPSFSCPTLEDTNVMMSTLLNSSTWQTAELHDAMTPLACCNACFGAPLQLSCAGTIPPRALPLCGAVASLALDATPDGRNDTEVNAGPARSSVLGGGASDRVADTARGKGMVYFQLHNAVVIAVVLSIILGAIALISHVVMLCVRGMVTLVGRLLAASVGTLRSFAGQLSSRCSSFWVRVFVPEEACGEVKAKKAKAKKKKKKDKQQVLSPTMEKRPPHPRSSFSWTCHLADRTR